MFEDLHDPNFSVGFDPKKKHDAYQSKVSIKKTWIQENWPVILAVSGLLLLLLAVSALYLLFSSIGAKKVPAKPVQNITATDTVVLPGNSLPDLPNNPNSQASTSDNIKGEGVSFGSFYKYDYPPAKYSGAGVALPLEIKNEVSNYYEVSRKIDLDKYLPAINRSGFAMIDSQFPESKDFYSAYATLSDHGLPQLLTSDFLLYYQQNKFKEVYDDIKANAFYKDLWHINKQFYDIANARYKQSKLRLGDVSSPVLEAERLEAAFFAVTLELLKPQKEQINMLKGSMTSKFTQREASNFEFELPKYLEDDVLREVAMIRFGNRVAKSPVLLYTRDYKAFEPAHALDDAKLRNFYLASKWLNSLFPIYSASEECPSCSLDNNDWLINFITAQYITEDFTRNQDLKNIWAKIYKINSYFSGLRHELTYLHYAEEVEALYGKEADLSGIFSEKSSFPEKLEIARKIRDRILVNHAFESIEGGIDRTNPGNMPQIGMKLLQDDFWPDDYIMSRLVRPVTTDYTGSAKLGSASGKLLNVTGCEDEKIAKFVRCRPIGLDVVSLFVPVNSGYYRENASYLNYSSEWNSIKSKLQYFTADTWHSNVYWNLFDIVDKSIAREDALSGPINVTSDDWHDRVANTALGAWVNLRLPTDRITSAWVGIKKGTLADSTTAEIVVEPNLRLINDLIANAEMLENILYSLKIVKDIDYSAKRLAEYSDELQKIKILAEKELRGEKLIEADRIFIGELLRKKIEPVRGAKKIFNIKYGTNAISESIEGMRWVVAVYQNGNNKMLVVGPIFKYQEAGKVPFSSN